MPFASKPARAHRHRPAPLAALVLVASSALAFDRAGAQAVADTIPSCVSGSPPLQVAGRRAVLDDDDRAGFEAAVLSRFRVLAESGFSTGQILLVARPDGGWTYVNVRAPSEPGAAPCFTASFSGDALAFTSQLVRKYFQGADKV